MPREIAELSNVITDNQSDIVHILENASFVNDTGNRYRHVRVRDVQQDTDFSACYVKGVVTSVSYSLQTSRGCTMKVSIKDVDDHHPEEPRDNISVLFRGQFVQQCTRLKANDLLFITGAQVEKSSRDGHDFNIIANENANLKIWIVQGPEERTAETQSAVVQNPLPSGFPQTTASAVKTQKTLSGENEPPSKRCKFILQPQVEKYTKLADLAVNTVVNVYGVVKFFKSPFKTKGSDFVCTLSLVDPSLHSLDSSFKCVLFSKSKESLPLVKAVGDVVRFHHLGVGQYQGELQGKFTADCSWVVFDIHSSDTPQVRASSSKAYNLTDDEKSVIEELKSWSSLKETLNKKFTVTSLKDLSTTHPFINLLAQVVAKRWTETGDVVLTLWDGSLPTCQSVLVEPISEQGQVMSDELMRKASKRCVDVFLYDNHVTGYGRKVCPGDFVCIRNVHLKERTADCSGKAQKPQSAQSRPLVSLEVHRGTICGRGVEILPANDPQVTSSAMMKFISKAEELMIQKEESNAMEIETMDSPPSDHCSEVQEKSSRTSKENCQNIVPAHSVESRALQTSCTITEHPCVPFTSIRNIKACKTVPNKFRCRVKAMMFLPSEVKDFVRRCCQSCRYMYGDCSGSSSATNTSASSMLCAKCNQETTLVFLFSFVLGDGSGLLHAMVFDKDAATFFPSLPSPQDFVDQSSFQQLLQDWMLSMTHNPENSLESAISKRDNKIPWLELCILSYTLQNEGQGRVLYRVFDSTFVGDSQ